MNNNKGFTLIELMIVVAIIGILAAIAIPAYQNYIARAQASEAYSLLSSTKTGISEYIQNVAEMPSMKIIGQPGWANNIDGGAKYVSSMTIIGTQDNLTVMATMRTTGINQNIRGDTIAINTRDSGAIWACGYASSGAADASASTSIDRQYLSSACK